jgi:hypothetical protein
MPAARKHSNRRPTAKHGISSADRKKVKDAWKNCKGDSENFPARLYTFVTWTCFECGKEKRHTGGCRFNKPKVGQKSRSKSSPPLFRRRSDAAALEVDSEITAAAAAAAEDIAASVVVADYDGLDEEPTTEDTDQAPAEDVTDEDATVDAPLLNEDESDGPTDDVSDRDVHPDEMEFATKRAKKLMKSLPRCRGLTAECGSWRENSVYHDCDYHSFPSHSCYEKRD